ncbi:MAG: gamma-glutamylcyclotransferase family protein [Pseudomonadales bacterium]
MLARYFAYGSNMDAARVAQRGLRVVTRQGAILVDHRLVFDKMAGEHSGAGHANIVRAPGEIVEGAVYELSEPAEILKMDPYERAPVNYTREAVALAVGSVTLWAWTYYANAARRAAHLRPTRDYLDHLLAGTDLLSESYSARLRALDCAS